MAEEDHPCCSASDAQANTFVTAESPSFPSEGEDRDMHDFLQQQHQRLDEQESVSATATFSPKDLNVLNLLAHPVWIFDISSKSMYWGNVEALKLWSAKSLKELLERNFASDMSESTYVRLQDYLKRFAKGEKIEDQWTMYPNFGKDGPKTIQCSMSGIQIETSSSSGTGNAYRLAMLVEAVYVETPTDSKEKEASDSLLRGLETLRHLPVVVRQFDLEGNLMDQNPEAIKLFGPELRNRDGDEQQDAGDTSLDTDTTQQQQQPLCEFLQCFEDLELGKSVLREVATHGNDYHLEAKQRTRISSNNASSQEDGMKWFSIKVRRVRDPVTSKPVLIYSARDVSTIMLKAQEEADKITSSKNEFFAVMAHEIRTPLHQVVGFIELLSRTTLDKEQYEFCSMLQSSTHALMAIINDLLDFTKLEAGKISLEKIPFEVRAVIDGCVAAMAPQAESKGVTLSSEIEHGIPVKLVGDPNRTRQIVLNMVQNAVKFTNGGPSGKVHIQASRIMRSSDAESGEEENAVLLRVEVQDTGIGISEDHLGRIFNPYQQADASVSRNYGGTGLGLAICDSLVQNMGGKIGVDSELGKGTKFWFEIPLQEHTRKQSNKSEQGISGADSERINNIGSEPTNVKLPKSSSGNKIMCQDEKKGADEVKGLRILVAEDNKVNQKVAGAMLKRLGHIPIIVENGQLAVDEIENHDRDYFDLVLMDIQMPVMDVSCCIPR